MECERRGDGLCEARGLTRRVRPFPRATVISMVSRRQKKFFEQCRIHVERGKCFERESEILVRDQTDTSELEIEKESFVKIAK